MGSFLWMWEKIGKTILLNWPHCLHTHTCDTAFHYTLYIDMSVLLENTPLIKFIRNYIQDLSGVFSISPIVKVSMISLKSSLSLKLYLTSLVYDQNIFGSSSEVFRHFWKCLEMFVWRSEQFWNIFGKSSKMPSSAWYMYIIKRTLHVSSKIWILCSCHKNNISLVQCTRSL